MIDVPKYVKPKSYVKLIILTKITRLYVGNFERTENYTQHIYMYT